MYKIIGADKQEYGPVSATQLHQWISEGRANGHTVAQAIGTTDWKPLAAFPEFMESLRVHSEAIPVAMPPPPPPVLTPDEIANSDYDLDITGCIGRGWGLVKNNLGLMVGGTLIVVLLPVIPHVVFSLIAERVAAGHTHDPVYMIVNGFFSLLVASLVGAPLYAGFFLVMLSLIRRQQTGIDGIFSGFQKGYLQLALALFVNSILNTVFMLPWNIIFVQRAFPALDQMQNAKPEEMGNILGRFMDTFLGSMPYFFIGLIPVIYITTSLLFILPLIADRGLSAGAAIKLSWRMVNKHWFMVFGLLVVAGLVNALGALCCGIGLLFTFPIGFAAQMYAYETIFSGRKTQDY